MRRLVTLIAAVALVATTAMTAAANPWETEDLFGQGMGGPVVAVNGAKINRGAKGLTASVTMPTPAPGSYNYPIGTSAGAPEAFSLWMFVFFNPEECAAAICGPGDLGAANVVAGAYNAGGHLTAGSNLTISGSVNEQTPTFGPPSAETIAQALALGYDIADAEIHLAIAPHGALAPELLPEQFKTPAGNPGFWWIALFVD